MNLLSEQLDAIHSECSASGVPSWDTSCVPSRVLSALERVRMLATRCQSLQGQLDRAKLDAATEKLLTPIAAHEAAFQRPHAGFEEFWERYPNRTGRMLANNAWRLKANDASTVRQIMLGLERWRKSEQWMSGAVERAARWLSEEMYLEEPATARAHGKNHDEHMFRTIQEATNG